MPVVQEAMVPPKLPVIEDMLAKADALIDDCRWGGVGLAVFRGNASAEVSTGELADASEEVGGSAHRAMLEAKRLEREPEKVDASEEVGGWVFRAMLEAERLERKLERVPDVADEESENKPERRPETAFQVVDANDDDDVLTRRLRHACRERGLDTSGGFLILANRLNAGDVDDGGPGREYDDHDDHDGAAQSVDYSEGSSDLYYDDDSVSEWGS